VLAFPCGHGGLLALPLCGAALTFFAAAKKVSKESGLTPLALKWVPWLGGGSGTSGIGAPAHSAFVTRQSFFRRRCARRCVIHWALVCPGFECERYRREEPVRFFSRIHVFVFLGFRRRSQRLPCGRNADGFPRRPVRDARSAEWERMMALSLMRNVRVH
jgi:hypothetical protein